MMALPPDQWVDGVKIAGAAADAVASRLMHIESMPYSSSLTPTFGPRVCRPLSRGRERGIPKPTHQGLNLGEHDVGLAQHAPVLEPHDPDPLERQAFVPTSVAVRISKVSRAVALDRESKRRTVKIGEKAAERDLPAELETAEAAITKQGPKLLLGRSRFAAQPSSVKGLGPKRTACSHAVFSTAPAKSCERRG
jgi:hypothetical protein